MGKKLLSVFFLLSLFFLNSFSGFGQECTGASVNISSSDTDNTICAGESVTFTANPENAGANPTYQWRVNGVNRSGETGFQFIVSNLTNNSQVTVVMNPGCTGATNVTSSPISIQVNPIPSAPSITGDNSVCAGDPISLSASSITGATYNWTGPDNFTFTGKDLNRAGATAGMSGTYTVTAIVNNCTSSAGSFNLTVNPVPGAPTPGNNGPICAGATLNLTANTISGATYSWTGPNNFTSNQQNPSRSGATTAMAGTYTVTATVNECTSVAATTEVTINSAPAAPTAGNGGAVCVGGTINLTASNITGASYSWTGPGGFTSNEQNPTRTGAITTMAGTYSVIATVAGCPGPSATTNVNVNTIPAAPAAGNGGPICVGGTIQLTAPTVSGGTYSWTGPGNFTSSQQNPSRTNATTAMAGDYNLTVTVNGCTSPAATTSVTVNTIPAAPTAGNGGAVCIGGTINLTATTVAGATYSWTGPGGFTSDQQNPTRTGATTAMAGTYSVTSTVNGCTSSASSTTVVVNTIPNAPTAGSNSPVCMNGTINLTANTITGATYSWTGPDGFTSTQQNPTISNLTAAKAGTYSVTATVNGCTSPSGTTSVTINSNVTPSVTISSTSTSICTTAPSGSTAVTFTATPVHGGTNPTYQWRRNGSTISGATGASYSASSLADGSQISVVMTSNATCAVPVTATSDIITMKGFTPPTKPVFVASAGNVNVSGGICPPATGLVYTVTPNANISSYDWVLPSGWVITNGAGTNSITVDVTGAASSGASFNIRVTAKNACGSISSDNFPVNVNNSASVYAGLDASICKGGSIVLSGESNGYAQNYEWTATPAGGSFSDNKILKPTYTPPPTFTGTISLKFISTKQPGNVNCPVVADEMILTVNAPPAITAHPSTASQTVCLNAPATPLSMTATGAGLTYQWYRNTNNLNSGGTLITGATSSSYTPLTTTAGTQYYYVTVGGTCSPAVTSNVSGAVTVNALPAITAQPSATQQTLCLNAAATQLSVTATGAGLTYQWYSNTTNSNSGGTLISGATAATYTPVTSSPGTLYYYVVVGGICTPAVTSNVSGAVTVNSPPAITAQPSTTEQIVCPNAAATPLSVTATGAGLTYQWYSNTTNSKTGGTSINGATSATYTPVTTNPGTSYYYVIVSGTCTPSVTSNVSGAVIVNGPPAITAQPSTTEQTLCLDASATELSVTATGAGLTYQWYSNTTNSNAGGTLITNATSATYTPVTTTAGTLYYYAIVSGTCSPPMTSNVSGAVTVNDPPAITAQPSTTEQTLCLGTAATELSVTATGAGLTYQWYSNTTNSNTGGTSISNATASTYTPVTTTAGTLYYYVVVSGTCGSPETSIVSGPVIVNELPAVNAQPSTARQALCLNGAATQLSVTATGAGVTYQWYSNTASSNTGGTSLGAAATSSIYTPETTTAGTLYYYVVVSGTCTPPVTSNVSGAVTVNEPVVITKNLDNSETYSVCAGFPIEFSVEATGTGLTYEWTRDGQPVGHNSPTFEITQASASHVGKYKVLVKGTAPCTDVLSQEIELIVNQNITINPQPPSSIVSCEGSEFITIEIEAEGNIYDYVWRKNEIPVSYGNKYSISENGSLTISSLTTEDAGSYDVVISSPAESCSQIISTPSILTVTPTVTINAFATETSTRCQGAETVTITTTANNSTGITYSLDAASLDGGNTIDAATGAVTYSADWIGTTTITASAAGCNGPATATHVVAVTPTVTIDAFANETSTRCQGPETVTTTTTANNSTGISYSLDATSLAGGNTIDAATGAVTYSANWSGTTTITASAAGCNGPATASHVVMVTPTVTIDAFANETSTRCQGAETITTTTTANNSTGITYSLDAASLAGGNTIDAGTGAVTYSANWSGATTISASAAGCNGPATATHVVTVTPTVTIDVFANETSTRCQGAETVTTTTTANNSTGISYSLDAASLAGGNTIDAATGAVTYSANWSGTTTITASAAGCNGPAIATHVVTVTPTVTIDAFANETSTRCQGAETITTTTTANNSTGITYSLDAASLAGGNTIDAATGAVTYSANWSGTTTISASAAGCNGPATATHVITVTPTVTIDVFANETSTRCQGAETVTTTTTANNSTGITYSLDAASLAGGNTIDAATGAVTYSATWSGITTITASAAGCNGPATATHVVTVTPTVTINAFSQATSARCQGAETVTITTTANNSTGITYSLDAASLAGGNTINAATGTVTYVAGWSGTTTITASAEGCNGPFTTSHVVTVDSLPIGGELNFPVEKPDPNNPGSTIIVQERVFTTCENAVEGYASKLILTGKTGQVVEWQYKTAASSEWLPYNSQATELNGEEVEELVDNKSTVFRAKIINGACSIATYSATAIVTVIPSNIKPSPVKAEPLIVCFGEDISLSSQTGYGESFGHFEGGDFTNAGIKNNGWNFTDPNGNEIPFDANANSGAPIHWHKTQPKWKFETAAINSPYTLTDMWWNPLSDGKTNEHFAITQGNFDSNMDTPPFTLTGLDEAKVTFDQAFNLTTGATIRVILLKNGVELKELYKVTGPATSGNYEGFGSGTPGVNEMSFDLGSYLGEANLKIRFEYSGVRRGDVWAVDNIKVPEGPQGVLLQWFYDDNPADATVEQIGQDNQELVTFTPRKIGWNDFEVKTALLLDSNGNACQSLDNFERVRVFVFDTYETTVAYTTGTCGSYTATLNASISGALQGPLDAKLRTFDGYVGEWKIVGPEGEDYTLKNQDANSTIDPINNPNVIFESENNGNFTITWELKPTAVYPDDYKVVELRGLPIENPACPPVSIPVTPVFTDCSTLDFDGDDDVIVVNDPFTGVKAIEAWIRPEVGGGTIISGPSFEISTPSNITANGRWYHLAVIYDGDDAGIYIDGVRTGNAPSGNGGGTRTSIGAKWTSTDVDATAYFSGWIEELRIWKNSPTLKEIRFMMNQRLKLSGTGPDAKVVTPLEGEVVPNKPVAGSYYTDNTFNLDEDGDAFYNQTAADLYAYYRLISDVPDPTLGIIANTYKPVDGNTPDLSLSGIPGRLYNMTTHQENTSPTPYFSNTGADGLWYASSTWARGALWSVPASDGTDWNIVRTRMNISSGGENITVLGLISENSLLNILGNNPENHDGGGSGSALRVTHYLHLDGNIDLNGESQLLQNHGSILLESSKGYVERDQQGKRNSYVYNYWSSPVSLTGSTPNNAPYTVKDVLMDGTNPGNPATINFMPHHAAADNARTTPITISTYWLWGFSPAEANVYAEWDHIRESGTLKTGEGFTMKGTAGNAALTDAQNYTFRGKPHNGNITTDASFGAYENYLIGNPYPSAMDTQEFMLDNLSNVPGQNTRSDKNVFDGALYFWDHIQELNHILKDYVGGYAVRNFLDAVPAVSVDLRINPNNAESGKLPGRYLPVGQGFLINSTEPDGSVTISGGEINFKNSQRVYHEDGNSGSLFLKPEIVTKESKNRSEDVPKIRLSFSSPVGYYRQILVGAVPHTTNGFDLGYDAPMMDNNVEDMYWVQGNNQLVIQGVPHFNLDQVLPLGIRIQEKKEFMIKIDTVENPSNNLKIYLKDKLTDTIHDLRKTAYKSTSEPGYINDRFEIVFFKEDPKIEPKPEVPGEEIDYGVELSFKHAHVGRELQILNPKQVPINELLLFDMNGKLITTYKNIAHEKEVRLPVKNYSAGVYIAKLYSESTVITKKIIIQN